MLGGDYVLGEGTTSVGYVEFRDFEKVRFEKLALKNPPSFPDDPFLEIGPSVFFLTQLQEDEHKGVGDKTCRAAGELTVTTLEAHVLALYEFTAHDRRSIGSFVAH